jgi:hypothetical protein
MVVAAALIRQDVRDAEQRPRRQAALYLGFNLISKALQALHGQLILR